MSDEFEDVSARIPMWNPATTKNEAGVSTELAATENSYIAGYFLGTRRQPNPKKPNEEFVIHRMHATKVGDHAHDGNEALAEGGSVRELWGSAVINNLLEDSVTPGQMIKITYLGKKSTQDGARTFKNYSVGASKTAEPVKVDNLRIVDYDVAPAQNSNADASVGAPKQEAVSTAQGAAAEEAEDDLPF